MKSTKRILWKNLDVFFGILACVGALIFFGVPILASFGVITYDMPVSQPVENVVAIRLLDTSGDEVSVLAELDSGEINDLYTELIQIRVNATAFDKVEGYGERSIQLCYKDGAYDIFGEIKISAFSPSGEWLPLDHRYSVPDSDLEQLIDKYFEQSSFYK